MAGLVFACRAEAPSNPTSASPQAAPSGASDEAPDLPARPAPDWKRAFRHEVRYDAERQAIVIAIEVDEGYHVYTEGETIGKPLHVALAEDGPYEIDGSVRYPEGVTKDLPIGRSVIVEGEAEVVAPIRPRNEEDRGKPGSAEGRFRYQVCTDEACDRPRTQSFEVDVAPTSDA